MKKVNFCLFFVYLFVTFSFVLYPGCEYDVASPQWEQDFNNPPTPQITQVEPAQGAVAGVNLITIQGVNFLDVPDTNGVYFDNVHAEIVSSSTSTIVVRRPNHVAAASTIKVVPNKTLVVAKYSPYKIDSVIETYGMFLDNLALSVVAVDGNENLYAVETYSKNIIKVDTNGERTIIGSTSRAPTDAVIGPDGRLYLPGNNREILVVDLQTGTSSGWTRLASGRVVTCGDFDNNGYFYTGGRRSQLIVVDLNLSDNVTGYYASDEIYAIRVYADYVYLAVKTASPDAQNPELAIWRHSIDGNGNVGDKELYLDLTADENIASRAINGIHFASNGTLFIGTDSPDPLLINASGSADVDYFYKNIVPSNCKHFCWGTGNYIYMIADDPAWNTSLEWNVFRVNMGIDKAN
jgi:hypothetical protein